MGAETLLLGVFLVSLALFLHPFVVYPVLLGILSRTDIARGEGRDETITGEYPTVTLVIAAYNEEDVIESKIENSLELEYPDDRLDIVVFSDASSDRTDEIVSSYEDSGVRLVRIEGRVGKTECQNRVVEDLTSDLIVFSDANTVYDPGAIEALVQYFDDDVGCVVGEVRYEADGPKQADDVEGESLYWRQQRLIKRLESRVRSVVKGNGAIYAVRRECYVPLPADAMSDFAEPLAIRSRGAQVRYAPNALAWEDTAGSIDAERARKVRMTTRSWHTITDYLHLLNPVRYGLYSFLVLSSTILLWSSPLFLIATVATALVLATVTSTPVFDATVALFALGGLFAIVGQQLDRRVGSAPIIFHVPHYFLVGNYSLLLGFVNFLQGRTIVVWETEDRSA